METEAIYATADAEGESLCEIVFSQFSNSSHEHHRHLCAVVGAMSHELKDQSLPLTHVAYFGATCSSLDRLSAETGPPGHVIDALLTFLSMVLVRTPVAILKKKMDYVSGLIVRVMNLKSVTPVGHTSGLRCISHLLISKDAVNWSDVSQLYGVLLGYMTDARPKWDENSICLECSQEELCILVCTLPPDPVSIVIVSVNPQVRRQSHLCLRDVMSSLQTPKISQLLPPASEAIASSLERFLLLAGGSNANASEGPKGAQEVLYILDCLKECLPFMSMRSSTSILKFYKSLLELRQPLVTRRITDSLNALCLSPTEELSSEVLLDLMCSLATSASTNETSADSMTFTARLLDVGMRKIYSLNREICVVKLPVVFNALKDVLASEHEEALFATTEAFKSLINVCIDESLIKNGVDQINVDEVVAERECGPTIIQKVCATVESLLDYGYAAVWDMSFQVVSTIFEKLGVYASYFLRGMLRSLSDMEKLPDEDFPFKKQLHECVGSAIRAMGPEAFLELLPLKLEAQDLSEANVWLFPILKQHIVCARLRFFTESILPMVVLVKQRSAVLEREGRVQLARSIEGITYSLWSLLPSFCNYSLDTAESYKDLEKALCVALREEPDVRGIICSSVQLLIQQNRSILEAKDDLSGIEPSSARQRAVAHFSVQVAGDNLTILKSSASELLSVLSGIFLKSSTDAGGSLLSAITEIASVSDKEVIARFFKTTMQKLLKVTQQFSKAQNSKNPNQMLVDSSSSGSSLLLARAQLFDLAVSLLPGLEAKEIDLLFLAIKSALKDEEGLIQKKAYKSLSLILRNSNGFMSRKLEELLNLMVEVLPSCHFSAKRHRLDCLYFLIVHVSKDESEQRRHDIIASFLTEIILALKESNRKTRNRAYDILVQIGHACGDEEKGGKKENLQHFFNMVAGGLAGETSYMISAAIKGLARLAYEFTDLISSVYDVLPSTFLLLRGQNREIRKASLGLLKVLVAISQPESLQTHLESMMKGLLGWKSSTKTHFKAKVKLLIEMLVKKCGLEAVKAVMPEEHMKLLTNIRKMNARKEKKNSTNSEESRSYLSRATTSRLSRWNHTKIFSDFGDEETENNDECTDGKTFANSKSSLRSNRKRKTADSLPEDLLDQLDDEPLDLLDRQKTRSALKSSGNLKRKQDSDDEAEIDSDGRLIILEGENKKPKKDKKMPMMSSDHDHDSDRKSMAGSHMSQKGGQKRRKTSDSGWAYTGKEYASRKAGGDVKKKDKLEPYAYWPLDRKMVSRRPEHRAAARKGMASVVKLTKNLEGKSVAKALSMKIKKKGSQKKRK